MNRIFGDNPNVPAPPAPPTDPTTDVLGRVLTALDQLGAAIGEMRNQQPVVHVAPPDLSEVVNAVVGIKGPASAEEIAAAIAREIRPTQDGDTATSATLNEVAEALKKLDFRLKGVGTQAFGGGAVDLSPGSLQSLASAIASGASGGGLTDTQLRATPVPVSGTVTTTGGSLSIVEALNFTAFDLSVGAYSGTTNIASDYQLDSLELHFSTRAKRTITLTTEDGTVVFKRANDVSQDINVPFGRKGFDGGEDLTLAVTQTTSACTVTGKLTTAQGSAAVVAGTAVTQGTSPWVVSSGSIFPMRNWGQFYNVRGQRYIATTDYVTLTNNAGDRKSVV